RCPPDLMLSCQGIQCLRKKHSRTVTVYSCDGKCPSATIFNFNINSHARFCKCCRESGLQTRTVSLYCSRNATVVEYNFQEPLDCSSLPRINVFLNKTLSSTLVSLS
uniref:CTCK domain-containing protein n=1 Tax=Oryzias latipes TaxID=8090 RepID=A0A3P9K2I9_ORYLA